jgi:predicted small secreted protein
MKIRLLILLLLLASSAFADTFRVHYSIRGSGRDITVQASSPSEARHTVMEMFPGAIVTGVHRRAKK